MSPQQIEPWAALLQNNSSDVCLLQFFLSGTGAISPSGSGTCWVWIPALTQLCDLGHLLNLSEPCFFFKPSSLKEGS